MQSVGRSGCVLQGPTGHPATTMALQQSLPSGIGKFESPWCRTHESQVSQLSRRKVQRGNFDSQLVKEMQGLKQITTLLQNVVHLCAVYSTIIWVFVVFLNTLFFYFLNMCECITCTHMSAGHLFF